MQNSKLQLRQLDGEWISQLKSASGQCDHFWKDFVGTPVMDRRTSRLSYELSDARLSDLADVLELDPEQLLNQTVNLRIFEAHMQGNVNELPERYRKGAFSRIRTSAHIFDAAEKKFGWRGRKHLLRRMQVNEATLGELPLRISLNFLVDVCQELEFMGISTAEFQKMGSTAVLRNYHTPAGDQFRETRSLKEMMERGFSETIRNYFENNYDYKLVYLTSSVAIVDGYGRGEVLDALGTKRMGSALTCQCKIGMFASVTAYKHLPFAKVTEVRCVHRGDPFCRYVIDFSHGHALERSRSGLPPKVSVEYSTKSEKT
ncbi:MAG: hypothetical protein EOP09_06305, partial [Proteobacteria bacterium]